MKKTYSFNLGWLKLLGVLFVALKLTDQIDWSWWWVTLPFWVTLAVGLTFSAVLFLVLAVLWTLELVLDLIKHRGNTRAMRQRRAARLAIAKTLRDAYRR